MESGFKDRIPCHTVTMACISSNIATSTGEEGEGGGGGGKCVGSVREGVAKCFVPTDRPLDMVVLF